MKIERIEEPAFKLILTDFEAKDLLHWLNVFEDKIFGDTLKIKRYLQSALAEGNPHELLNKLI